MYSEKLLLSGSILAFFWIKKLTENRLFEVKEKNKKSIALSKIPEGPYFPIKWREKGKSGRFLANLSPEMGNLGLCLS